MFIFEGKGLEGEVGEIGKRKYDFQEIGENGVKYRLRMCFVIW